MLREERPIGVFDSGVGGLTVVRSLRKVLPAEDIVYLGDTARVPYGCKSAATVTRYSLACAEFLVRKGIKLLVVACNTASAFALPELARRLEVPVLGAVEPGARAASRASRSGRIGVIGTLGTIASSAYTDALKKLSNGAATVTGQACPLLVPLAEEGWLDDDIAAAIAVRYLGKLAETDPTIDTLVLGCTHYPLLETVLTRAAEQVFARPVVLVDSATAMAEAAQEILAARGETRKPRSAAGKLECHVTDASRLDKLAPLFLGEPIESVALVDL
ncbi:MAG: glutamate racemase [Pseudomonadota bacterium]